MDYRDHVDRAVSHGSTALGEEQMSTFHVSHRYLRLVSGGVPDQFPAKAELRIRLGPEDAFGICGDGARTTLPRARAASFQWNANEGIGTWEGELIDTIRAPFPEGEEGRWIDGNLLKLRMPVRSVKDAEAVASSANQFVPALFSLRLRVFVWIKQFEVDVGPAKYNYEVATFRREATIATREVNTREIEKALSEWSQVREEHLRLLLAAHYYRQALRLKSCQPDTESMFPEVALNLAKSIEIVLGGTRDQVRARLTRLGYPKHFTEKRVVPLLLIRSKLGVAHVMGSALSVDEREAVLHFIDAAMLNVRTVLTRLFEAVRLGDYTVKPMSSSLDKEKAELLAAITSYLQDSDPGTQEG